MLNVFETAREKCQKCGVRDVELVCRTCGAGLCRNCIIVTTESFPCCLTCGSRNIKEYKTKRVRVNSVDYVCEDCKSREITILTKYVKICPECGSTEIVDFAEEQATLKMNFRKLCLELKYGYLKLNRIAHSFDLIKRGLVFLRRSRFLNYPVIEKVLIDVFNEFHLIKMRILGKVEEIGNLILSMAPRFSVGAQFKVQELPFLRGVLTRIETELKNYKNYVDESTIEVTEKLAKVEVLVSSIYQHYQEFRKYRDFLSLDMDENPIYGISGAKFLGLNTIQVPKGEGMLFLTNKRLIFLSEKGIFKKSFHKLFEVPLNRISDVEIKGKLKKRLIVKYSDGDLVFSFPSKMLQLARDYIRIALDFKNYSLRDPKVVSRVNSLTLETSDLKTKIKDILKRIRRAEEQRDLSIPKTTTLRRVSHSTTTPINPINRLRMELYNLEREKYEIEKSLKELKHYFESGLISVENYFKYYRSWVGKLYVIEKKILELRGKCRNFWPAQ